MKIAVTSQGNTLDSKIDQRFGRCQYFLFVDSETMEFESYSNPNINASGGAGVQSAQFVVNQNPEVLITGRLGPKADSTLKESTIKIITGKEGTIKDIITEYCNGQ